MRQPDCDWCGESDENCWCDAVTEDFKNGLTEHDWETVSDADKEGNTMHGRFVLVSQSAHGSWVEYYSGKTYTYHGECFAVIVKRDEAKIYKSKKRAELAAESLSEKVGERFIVEEI